MEESDIGYLDETMCGAMAAVLEHMSEVMPFARIAPLRLVCRAWRRALDETCTLHAAKADVCDVPGICAGVMALELKRRPAVNLRVRVNVVRRTMANDTLAWAETVFDRRRPWPPELGDRMAELQMMARVSRQFVGTAALLERIGARTPAHGPHLTENFDHAEMGLRRRIEEVVTATRVPADCIADPDARARWTAAFGARASEVTWEDLVDRFVGDDVVREFCAVPSFLEHLRTFLCFPELDTVVPYAVHLLASLYGRPWSDVWRNFAGLVSGHGFVGIMNTEGAAALFASVRHRMHTRAYLLRYSRSVPDAFSVTTYDPADGRIEHMRNAEPRVPLPVLRAKMLTAGYRPARFSLDGTLDPVAALDVSESDRQRYSCFY
jgi:hypothetical protein